MQLHISRQETYQAFFALEVAEKPPTVLKHNWIFAINHKSVNNFYWIKIPTSEQSFKVQVLPSEHLVISSCDLLQVSIWQ